MSEFRDFLLNGQVIDLLEKRTALELFHKLNPQAVESGERNGIKFVQARSEERIFRRR